MIDTDKYEGHTEGEWHVDDDGVGLIIKWGGMPHDFVDMENKANAQLMADAPKLLAEVKRLRERVKTEHNLKLWEKAEVKRLREQYAELREALVGDSPNWTHEELIEKALELIDNE